MYPHLDNKQRLYCRLYYTPIDFSLQGVLEFLGPRPYVPVFIYYAVAQLLYN